MANVKTDSHIDHALLRFHPTLRFERTDPNAISSSSCSKAAAQSSVVSVAEDDGDGDARSREAPAAFVMPPPPGNRFAPIKDIAKLACFAEEARQHLLQPSSAEEHVRHQHQHSHLLAFGRPKPPNTSPIMHHHPHHPHPHPPRYTPLPIVFQRRWSSLVAPSSSSSRPPLPALRAAARAQGLHLLCSGGSAHHNHHHCATVRVPNLVCLHYNHHRYQIGEGRPKGLPLLFLSQQNKSCFVRKINRIL